MTNTPQPPFPSVDTVSLASIQREYLEDLKCRVSPGHYKNVKARLDRLATALQIGDLHQLQPLQLIRYPQPSAREGRREPDRQPGRRQLRCDARLGGRLRPDPDEPPAATSPAA